MRKTRGLDRSREVGPETPRKEAKMLGKIGREKKKEIVEWNKKS